MRLNTYNLYFQECETPSFNEDFLKIEKIIKYFESENNKDEKNLDFENIIQTQNYVCSYEFYNKYKSLKCISCAISEIIFKRTNLCVFIYTRIQFENFEEENKSSSFETFDSISCDMINSIIKIKGTVCFIGAPCVENFVGFFECSKCHNKISTRSKTEKIFKIPKTCPCKSKTLSFLPIHPETSFCDFQEIQVLEYLCGNKQNVLAVILNKNLINYVKVGDTVEIIGMVMATLVNDEYLVKINANNIKLLTTHISCRELNENVDSFLELSQHPNLLGVLISTIFENVHGQDLLKVGMILSLFGGSKEKDSDEIAPINVYISGDIGTGKTNVLNSAKRILPKSTYFSFKEGIKNNNTKYLASGINNKIIYNKISEGYAVQAGVFVLNNGGVCFIDDLHERRSLDFLFDVVLKNSISNTEKNFYQNDMIKCNLHVNCTVIAAATNNKKENDVIRESVINNCFDLHFKITDKFSIKKDYQISGELLKKRTKFYESETSTNMSSRLQNVMKNIKADCLFYEETEERKSVDLIRRFIMFSRREINPNLTKNAEEYIKSYYLEQKTRNQEISSKVYESIVKISEAYSKMRWKKVVEEEDAKWAVKYYKKIMEQKIKTKEKKNGVERVLSEFISENGRKILYKEELCEIIGKMKIKQSVAEYIEVLNYKGIVVKKNTNEYLINL
ncbi:Mcm8 [Ecytonucleospora hepatopenaei]|uniref:Mcm8 n=1 Tax=Ecytonucleospora hepatopenaei TaxID=646526 RepID=A0A1W0E342_9MICR|nr:Mcm8 [Ecytonucleospora hepatopenaei]